MLKHIIYMELKGQLTNNMTWKREVAFLCPDNWLVVQLWFAAFFHDMVLVSYGLFLVNMQQRKNLLHLNSIWFRSINIAYGIIIKSPFMRTAQSNILQNYRKICLGLTLSSMRAMACSLLRPQSNRKYMGMLFRSVYEAKWQVESMAELKAAI